MFNFSRGQRNGLMVLALLIVMFSLAPIGMDIIKTDFSSNFYQFEEELNQAHISMPKQSMKQEYNMEELPLFNFDPNTVDEQNMLKLGFNDKQIKQIVNYRAKNGKFYKKDDLNKIYAIDKKTYNRLKGFIVIPQKKKSKNLSPKTKSSQQKTKRTPISVEINSATAEDLQEIKGIGNTFAQRIIKYRDALGGFVQKKQMLEVYGIDNEKYKQIEKQFWCNSKHITKINVNFSTTKTFEKHPYFSKNQAKNILKNKTFNGRYKSLNDFQKRLNLSEEFIHKIKDYLLF